MLVSALVAAFGLAVCAAALWRSTLAAADGSLARNGGVGIRTAATRRSDAAWQAAHRAAVPLAQRLAVACLVMAAVVLAVGILAGSHVVLVFAAEMVGYLVLLLGVVPVVRAANRAAREADLREHGHA